MHLQPLLVAFALVAQGTQGFRLPGLPDLPSFLVQPTPGAVSEQCQESITFDAPDNTDFGYTLSPLTSPVQLGVWFRGCPDTDPDQRCFEKRRCRVGSELPSSSAFPQCMQEQRCTSFGRNCRKQTSCNSASPTPSPTPTPTRQTTVVVPCQESITFEPADQNDFGYNLVDITDTTQHGVWFRHCPNTDPNQRCFEKRRCIAGMQLPPTSLFQECKREERCTATDYPNCRKQVPCEATTTPAPTPDTTTTEPCEESIAFEAPDHNDPGYSLIPLTTSQPGVWFRRCPNTDPSRRCFEKRRCVVGDQLPSSSLFSQCMEEQQCNAAVGLRNCRKQLPCDLATPAPTPEVPTTEPCEESITFQVADVNQPGTRFIPANDDGIWFRRCPNTDPNVRCFEKRRCRASMVLPSSSLFRKCMWEETCTATDHTTGLQGVCLKALPCQ